MTKTALRSVPVQPRPLHKTDNSLKGQIARSIGESMSAESESFANYLATKLLREFNITEKD